MYKGLAQEITMYSEACSEGRITVEQYYSLVDLAIEWHKLLESAPIPRFVLTALARINHRNFRRSLSPTVPQSPSTNHSPS